MWEQPATTDSPPDLPGHASCILDDCLYIFGGAKAGQLSRDMHILELRTGHWRLCNPYGNVPAVREGHSLTAGPDSLVLIGGATLAGLDERRMCHGVYVFSVKKLKWRRLDNTDFPLMSNHSCVSKRLKYYCFGGWGGEGLTAALWCFDATAEKWLPIEAEGGPSPREQHQAARVGTRMYIYGGKNDEQVFGDLWYFNLDSRHWHQLTFSSTLPRPPLLPHVALTAVSDTLYLVVGRKEDSQVWRCSFEDLGRRLQQVQGI